MNKGISSKDVTATVTAKAVKAYLKGRVANDVRLKVENAVVQEATDYCKGILLGNRSKGEVGWTPDFDHTELWGNLVKKRLEEKGSISVWIITGLACADVWELGQLSEVTAGGGGGDAAKVVKVDASAGANKSSDGQRRGPRLPWGARALRLRFRENGEFVERVTPGAYGRRAGAFSAAHGPSSYLPMTGNTVFSELEEEDSAIACTKDELEGYDDDTTDYSSETDDEDEWMDAN
ncbi:hypothetical protein WJX75_004314 [Coccomyxa subellipsoidea]|uniref:Uncharacterized protein n=1 Tax=Coccomyxa subellipsoidea TaxID=248742 RepID=A0ABR2YGH3_9CHLO